MSAIKRMVTLQERISGERERLGLSKARAGRLIGVSRSHWRYLEQGHSGLTLRSLGLIAHALNMCTSDLIRDTEHDIRKPVTVIRETVI
jgi:transcriptional regulator with XRE-family HTH domain